MKSFAPTSPASTDVNDLVAPLSSPPTVQASDVNSLNRAEDLQPARPPRLAPYVAFFIAVFASMAAAAAAVASSDLPVMVVGLL